ncbi:hypothetical protein Glove_520g15 [Diversispora epigaea]|uniref:Protein kinase domain-containing protein n=1 Tax=Diversispora epigaea TaxID=1348612 RepID=A0A397GIA2_9GLOM|nr:hypothetical protein Glove_520g15 [Diversispora epigaea]
MSFSHSKKDSFKNALENGYIRLFDYNTFDNPTKIAEGSCGTVFHANSKILGKDVSLKSLHGVNKGDEFYKKFVNELKHINAVNHHDNIINFYGVSIDHSETLYMVLQYAKDGDLRTYLQTNFEKLDWKIKINMAKDIARGLYCIHEAKIVHKDLHSKNILVHEGRLLIADLGLSKSLDTNSSSLSGGMIAYTDPAYLKNMKAYKRNKASDIYSLGILFWELSSGRSPFHAISCFEIYNTMIISGKREADIHGTPIDYINIYSKAWNDDPNQRPTIKDICYSLENIRLENVYNISNSNQLNQPNVDHNKPMEKYSKDTVSIFSDLEITDQERLDNVIKSNQIIQYGYNSFENIEFIGRGFFGGIYSATLKNENMKVVIKSTVVNPNSIELFVNELKNFSNVNWHENVIKFFGISQKDVNSEEYIFVLEYANGGTLRNYLKTNFRRLDWSDKLNYAQQIAKAIKHLHSYNIILGNLSSRNVLIHNNNIKISNFDTTKFTTKLTIDLLKSLRLIEYTDPMIFKIQGEFSRTKASDMFSVGILLWEISSGRIPYDSYFQNDLDKKISYIIEGRREKPITGTPKSYVKLYQECWDQDPKQRPNIEKITHDLEFITIIIESME